MVLDNMKETILTVHLTKEEPAIDSNELSLILKTLRPYASLFLRPVSFPGIFIAAMSVVIPIVAPFIKNRLKFLNKLFIRYRLDFMNLL
jgi:hypothetical protein